MTDVFGIEDGDVEKSSNGFETLGPAYFAARRAAAALMANADTSPFQDVAKKAADDVRGQVYDYIEHYILSDLECNIQGHVTRMVDDTVCALLTGQAWAMERYPYYAYSRGEEVRAAVAKHGGEKLLMARISDLEKEIERLRESLRWAQERRY